VQIVSGECDSSSAVLGRDIYSTENHCQDFYIRVETGGMVRVYFLFQPRGWVRCDRPFTTIQGRGRSNRAWRPYEHMSSCQQRVEAKAHALSFCWCHTTASFCLRGPWSWLSKKRDKFSNFARSAYCTTNESIGHKASRRQATYRIHLAESIY
jgi:hypothetical protein